MSFKPTPPARVDPKKRVRPSSESVGPPSMTAVLIPGPRFTGTDQPKNAGGWGAAPEYELTMSRTTKPISSATFRAAPTDRTYHSIAISRLRREWTDL